MRITLNATQPRKLGSFTCQTAVHISVPNAGQSMWIAHDSQTLKRNVGTPSLQEGIPLVQGNTPPVAYSNGILWQGDLWAIGSVDGMTIDVEAYGN